MNLLKQLLIEEIKERGPVPFRRFMELALYHPKFGYYEQPDRVIGRKGDFFTSVSVGGLFGELLGFQFAEWFRETTRFQIVEAGAHDGQLASDILNYFSQYRPDRSRALEYWIIEPSRRRREKQREQLQDFSGTVKWLEGWEAVPARSITGVIFSNELLDAMPVHRLGWNAGEKRWFEWGVDASQGEFSWRRLPPPPGLEKEFVQTAFQSDHTPKALAEVLPDQFTTEFSPGAGEWWRQAGNRLKQGKLLTLDYGLEARQFFSPERSRGTLRAYAGHRIQSDPLQQPGERDLTCSVNFTALADAGASIGLRTEQLVSQESFLTGIASQTWKQPRQFPEWNAQRKRQFATLTHPDHLGGPFKVLIQSC